MHIDGTKQVWSEYFSARRCSSVFIASNGFNEHVTAAKVSILEVG